MPISHQHKIIFVHIPKTAGTSIEFALGMHGSMAKVGQEPYLNQERNIQFLFGNGLQHLSAKKIISMVGKDIFNAYHTFSIVRNPFDRLVSHVAWLNRKWYDRKELSQEEFNRFVCKKTWFSLRNKALPVPQYRFLYSGKSCLVDRIIKFENLQQELLSLQNDLNLNFQLETRMKSYHKPYSYYYNSELAQIVRKFYAKDFEWFGYQTSIEQCP